MLAKHHTPTDSCSLQTLLGAVYHNEQVEGRRSIKSSMALAVMPI